MNLNNIVKSRSSAKSRGRDNFNYGGRGVYRGRGHKNYRGKRHGNFNQGRDNNFRASNQGRDENNFGPTNRGRGQGRYYHERTNFGCFYFIKFGHKATDYRFKQKANVVENQDENVGEHFSNSHNLFLVSNACSKDGST